MRVSRVYNPQTNGSILIMEGGRVEYVNPIDHFTNMMIQLNMELERSILLHRNPPYPIHFFDRLLKRRAEAEWKEEFERIQTVKLPENLSLLFESTSKKGQINLLKGISLNSDELLAFTFMAWEKYGFTFSQYTAEHKPNGLEGEKFPTVFHKDEDKVDVIGDTSLSHGQLKQVLEQRHVVIIKIFDNGNNWHCLFSTYKSIDGKEAYKGGQPHLHYISNLWNLSREKVLTELLSKNYKLPSTPHIDFYTHRNPRSKDD